MTRWAKDVSPEKVHPEYPRPQMLRKDWTNLNGLWEFAITSEDASALPTKYDGQILVPFPIESALSGVMKRVGAKQQLWYRRNFQSPALKDGARLLLHFGAVDWKCEVTVNGKSVGQHTGGYDPFSFDITDAIKPNAEQELVVRVSDPSDANWQPRGKQVNEPKGIWYTPTTGIWQTVWLETVPAASIADVKVVPDVDAGKVRITVLGRGTREADKVEIALLGRAEQQCLAVGRSKTSCGGNTGDARTSTVALRIHQASDPDVRVRFSKSV
jgi:beta-galactosidase/beta-glucuronidase